MLVAYLDETYLKNVEHALVALVLPVDKIPELESKLDAVVAKAVRQHDGLPESIELHGYELSGGENAWSELEPRARVRIYKEAIEAITSVDGTAFCRGSVNLTLHSPGDAHEWALKIALECVNSVAGRTEERVVGICDDVGNKSVYQNMYAHARRYGTGGLYQNNLDNFTDGLHFTPSCYSRPVQAVDLVSYVYRRTNMTKFRDERAQKVMADFWNAMEPMRLRGAARTW